MDCKTSVYFSYKYAVYSAKPFSASRQKAADKSRLWADNFPHLLKLKTELGWSLYFISPSGKCLRYFDAFCSSQGIPWHHLPLLCRWLSLRFPCPKLCSAAWLHNSALSSRLFELRLCSCPVLDSLLSQRCWAWPAWELCKTQEERRCLTRLSQRLSSCQGSVFQNNKSQEKSKMEKGSDHTACLPAPPFCILLFFFGSGFVLASVCSNTREYPR